MSTLLMPAVAADVDSPYGDQIRREFLDRGLKKMPGSAQDISIVLKVEPSGVYKVIGNVRWDMHNGRGSRVPEVEHIGK